VVDIAEMHQCIAEVEEHGTTRGLSSGNLRVAGNRDGSLDRRRADG